MNETLSFAFKFDYYRACTKYKLEHPGELEERTKKRKEREKEASQENE